MKIKTINTKKFKFGSIEWQNAMLKNIIKKLENNMPLDSFEDCFVKLQEEHNRKI